ncbi:nuclear transport factor 2 family protein [Flavobacterium sp. UBA6135]|uniref:nuclear transport factor 2 family protein n=1 Tax=Flavobacterium sp. UBA6135 TaxID=1946553 RepID=UPI0025BB4EBA|nr:nuclear transport factor 2 family protein [Flavobacterium sp. UBA6135]
MNAKEIVLDFYNSDALSNPELMDSFLHPDVVLEWNSSKGFVKKSREDLLALAEELKIAYVSSIVQIHHIIAENNEVAVRYTHFATTIENPNHINVLANFFVVWEVQDGKLFKGYQMSQLP